MEIRLDGRESLHDDELDRGRNGKVKLKTLGIKIEKKRLRK